MEDNDIFYMDEYMKKHLAKMPEIQIDISGGKIWKITTTRNA